MGEILIAGLRDYSSRDNPMARYFERAMIIDRGFTFQNALDDLLDKKESYNREQIELLDIFLLWRDSRAGFSIYYKTRSKDYQALDLNKPVMENPEVLTIGKTSGRNGIEFNLLEMYARKNLVPYLSKEKDNLKKLAEEYKLKGLRRLAGLTNLFK